MIRKSDPRALEQLALGLDLPEPEEEAGLSREDVQRISLAAMSKLEAESSSHSLRSGAVKLKGESSKLKGDKDSTWLGDYLRLKELGFTWRVAAYIAWEASPKGSRWPGSVTELATEVLGLKSPRVIYTWRKKNPAIDEIISVMQTEPLYEHRRDVIEALIAVASDPDYKGHSDRRLFFEMIGDYVPRSQVDLGKKKLADDDLSEMSDEELRRLTERLSSSSQDDDTPTRSARGLRAPMNLDGSRLEDGRSETEDGQDGDN